MDAIMKKFLIDDIRALINAINNNQELAAMEIRNDDGSFDTLEDFARYWEIHIEELNK